MNISAVLLAGGESSRMGRDKATLLFHGKPLWQIQLDLLRSLGPSEILLSARTDPQWRPAEVTFVADGPPSRGPLSGISASLAQIRGNHLLVLAIDMPFMNSEYLLSLGRQIGAGCGVLPMIGGLAEPLAAIYPAEASADFLDALSGTEFSLQKMTNELVKTGKLRTVEVTKDNEGLFRNLNEPSDLEL